MKGRGCASTFLDAFLPKNNEIYTITDEMRRHHLLSIIFIYIIEHRLCR
jgi:hypothetical protein